MENPQRDLPGALSALTTSRKPSDLREAVDKFYTQDASLHHPFRIVEHGKNSSQKILGVFEWCRIVSPDTTIEVNSVLYDKKNQVVVAEVTQNFRPRISPFKAAPSRYIIRLKLQERDRLLYIYSQEDFLHPMDLMNSILPPLTPLVRLALVFFAFMTAMCSKVWVFSLLLWVKLFGIGSDIQRGRAKQGSKKSMKNLGQGPVLETSHYGSSKGNSI
ncbi:hypothetical protein DEU56DRAFT_816851, partial [Suillus clintonianus]|uniref:uncharacterized protein n=1 Tax=Suillus clintonianus TaxID=1904413 RepID=UPI001B86B020